MDTGRYWITKSTDQGLTVEMVEGKNLTRVFVQVFYNITQKALTDA
jgi:hypothetical protein